MLELNKLELETLIATGVPIIVDFWKDNCPWCVKMVPVFEEAAKEYPEITFVKCKMENVPYKIGRLGFKSAPTIVIFDAGKHKWVQPGYLDKEQLKAFIEGGANGLQEYKATAPIAEAPVNPFEASLKAMSVTELMAEVYKRMRDQEARGETIRQLQAEIRQLASEVPLINIEINKREANG